MYLFSADWQFNASSKSRLYNNLVAKDCPSSVCSRSLSTTCYFFTPVSSSSLEEGQGKLSPFLISGTFPATSRQARNRHVNITENFSKSIMLFPSPSSPHPIQDYFSLFLYHNNPSNYSEINSFCFHLAIPFVFRFVYALNCSPIFSWTDKLHAFLHKGITCIILSLFISAQSWWSRAGRSLTRWLSSLPPCSEALGWSCLDGVLNPVVRTLADLYEAYLTLIGK